MSPEAVRVRHALASDAQAVTDLLTEVYEDGRFFVGDGPAPPAALSAHVATDDPDRCLYLVALRGRRVVGWLELHRSPAWRLKHVATLTIAVSRASRRSGVGRRLLAASYAWCREVGVEKISLSVREGNAAAIALYLSEGFEVEGRERGQVRLKRGEDGFEDNLLMARWLPGARGRG